MRTIKEVISELLDGKDIINILLVDTMGNIIETKFLPQVPLAEPRRERNAVQASVIVHTGIRLGRDIDATRADYVNLRGGELDKIILYYKLETLLMYRLKQDYIFCVRISRNALRPDVISRIEKAKTEIEELL